MKPYTVEYERGRISPYVVIERVTGKVCAEYQTATEAWAESDRKNKETKES